MKQRKSVVSQALQERMKNYPVFYQKVWQACASIPTGETRTYAWIAARIGKPKAYRAVARALAHNPFAPEIPCHRVICSDGSLGGYSGPGGVGKKRLLLAKEARV